MTEARGDDGPDRGSFSETELERWFESAQDVHLAAPSLVWAAIDGEWNGLTFGLARPEEDRTALEKELVRLGIPPEAIKIEKSQPFEPM
jgi:hypothetical protein